MTLDQLKKRGIALANRCYLCLECAESVNHLLLHCAKTRLLWEFFFFFDQQGCCGSYYFLCLALLGAILGSMKETLLSWDSFRVGKMRWNVWQVRSSCLF